MTFDKPPVEFPLLRAGRDSPKLSRFAPVTAFLSLVTAVVSEKNQLTPVSASTSLIYGGIIYSEGDGWGTAQYGLDNYWISSLTFPILSPTNFDQHLTTLSRPYGRPGMKGSRGIARNYVTCHEARCLRSQVPKIFSA